jgi:polysaccharide deacetylase family protein (PEP-CTERM system associated)
LREDAAIISVDLEEWFHGHNYLERVPPAQWADQTPRVEANTERCLELLARYDVRATFFVLGWTAARHPELVTRIAAAGHEIGCHSFAHPILFRLKDAEFVADLHRARDALAAAGVPDVAGYRAPSFTLTRPVHHFLELLRANGFRYSSSLFAVRHPRYGQPAAPRHPFRLAGEGPPFVEVPMTTARLAGINLPFSGGGYLRLSPLPLFRALRKLAGRQGVPLIVYLHPWELDDFRPDAGQSFLGRLRSQGGQATMPGKLEAILAEGSFVTMGEYVANRLARQDLPSRSLPLY